MKQEYSSFFMGGGGGAVCLASFVDILPNLQSSAPAYIAIDLRLKKRSFCVVLILPQKPLISDW